MEGFLEANRVVEISLSKFSSRSSDLPLRKTLFITQVLTRAQDVATSAQDCLLSSQFPHSNRHTSKLLASFGHDQSDIDDLPSPHRTLKASSRRQSPIAKECYDNQVTLLESGSTTPVLHSSDDEPMDFNNVTSFLSGILDSDSGVSHASVTQPSAATEPLHLDSWDTPEVARPVSPGKRNYQQAFPFATQSQEELEGLKRFKSYTVETCPLDSLPNFCGYLSSKNLQTAPFIAYMFGRGFTHPSNPDSNTWDQDWPPVHMASLKNSPILAF
jgi:hypothetical protein